MEGDERHIRKALGSGSSRSVMEYPIVFKLETAIATWRHQFKHSRLFLKADVDELERHIRDQVQFLVERGTSEEDAFRKTVSELGSYIETEREYRKVFWEKLRDSRSVTHESPHQ